MKFLPLPSRSLVWPVAAWAVMAALFLPGRLVAAQAAGATVTALGGQTVVNAEAHDTVRQGQLVTLSPSNVTDEKQALSIARIEYYSGEKLVQTVDVPPYVWNTKNVAPGSYTITERTYYGDGSQSEQTQHITVIAATSTQAKPAEAGNLVAGGIICGLAAALVVGLWWRRQHTVPERRRPFGTGAAK